MILGLMTAAEHARLYARWHMAHECACPCCRVHRGTPELETFLSLPDPQPATPRPTERKDANAD